MDRGRLRGFILGALVVACVAPAAASAETATIGSPLTSTFSSTFGCGVNCTMVQTGAPANVPFTLTSPANGVITSWSVRAANVGARWVFRVLHPAGGVSYTGAGTALAPAPTPTSTETTYTYPTFLPIKKGDAIGLIDLNGAAVPYHFYPSGTGWTWRQDPLGPSEGGTDAFAGQPPNTDYELLFGAKISFCRVPDVAGKKLAEAQTLVGAAKCAATATNRKLKRTKKNKKKKGEVLSQSLTAGDTAPPGTIVELTIGKLKKK